MKTNKSLDSLNGTFIKIAILIIIVTLIKGGITNLNLNTFAPANAQEITVQDVEIQKMKNEKSQEISDKLKEITGVDAEKEINDTLDTVNKASQLDEKELESKATNDITNEINKELNTVLSMYDFNEVNDLSFELNLGGK